jgi:hypothetical protein
MRKSNFKEPKNVLVFNGARVLIAIVRSLHSASQLSGGNLQSISFCCTGKYVSTGGFYFRHLNPKIEVDMSDLDTLTVNEYDELCCVNRSYHTVKEMAKKREQQEQKRMKMQDKTKTDESKKQ